MIRLSLGFMLLAMALAGCGSSAPTLLPATATAAPLPATATAAPLPTGTAARAPSPTATVNPAGARQAEKDALANAERKWQASGVVSYQITVSKSHPFGGETVNMITVRNGQVTTPLPPCQSVTQSNCLTGQGIETWIIPGLFADIRADLNNQQGVTRNLTFDPTYGFPRIFDSFLPAQSESAFRLEVRAFQPLP